MSRNALANGNAIDRFRTGFLSCAMILLCATLANAQTADQQKSSSPKTRTFVFHYGVTITDLPPKSIADIWIPVATTNRHQTVSIAEVKLPGEYRKTREKRFGNSMYYLRAVADGKGRIALSIDFIVKRKAVSPETGELVTAEERKQFLLANRMVPLGGKPFKMLLDNKPVGKSRAAMRSLYDRVDRHLRYDKPAGGKWGRGDVVWVCDSRYGNCSDFHSLFISLCRTSGVPARFRIGFPISEDKEKGPIGGYHCWAEFADGKRWFAVDISEANKHPSRKDEFFGRLPPDRVLFSTGRDLILEPKQKSGPLNFFVYPHVEVNGKQHTKMQKEFAFTVKKAER